MRIPPLRVKPTQYPTIRVVNPGKGLNTLVSAELIDDHEASDLNNVVFTEAGTVTKGPGVTSWGTGLSNDPRGLGSFHSQGGTRQVVTVDGGRVKSTTTASSTWTAAAGATLTSNVPITFTSARTNPNSSTGADVLFIWDGTTSGCYYDGTTVTRPGTMPSASFSMFFNGLHVAAGTSTNTSRLYIADINQGQATGVSLAFQAGTESWFTFTTPNFNATLTATIPPNPDNPTDVPGATVAGASGVLPQIIDINPGDGDQITGLAKFQNSIIVFKKRSIYQLAISQTGPVVTQINTYLGAVSHRSIDNVENDVFYLTTLGWMTLGYQEGYYTIIRTNELSVRIHPLIATINPANLTNVSAIYQPYWFLCSVPTGGSSFNNLTVVYDKRYDAWSKLDYINAESFTVYTDSSQVQHLLYTDATSAAVWEIQQYGSVTTNNGTAISSHWVSKTYDGGMPELMKFWIDVTLYFRQLAGTITVTIYTDNGIVAHTSTIGGQQFNGGIAATGYIGSELYGGNSSTNAVGDPYPANSASAGQIITSNVPYRIQLSVQSRTLMIKIEEDTVNTFGYLGHALTYRPMSHFVFDSNYIIQ